MSGFSWNNILCPPPHLPPPDTSSPPSESMCQAMLVIPTYYILNTIAKSSPLQPALFIWQARNPKIAGFINRAASYAVPEVPHGPRGLRPFCGEAARPSRRRAIPPNGAETVIHPAVSHPRVASTFVFGEKRRQDLRTRRPKQRSLILRKAR